MCFIFITWLTWVQKLLTPCPIVTVINIVIILSVHRRIHQGGRGGPDPPDFYQGGPSMIWTPSVFLQLLHIKHEVAPLFPFFTFVKLAQMLMHGTTVYQRCVLPGTGGKWNKQINRRTRRSRRSLASNDPHHPLTLQPQHRHRKSLMASRCQSLSRS